MDELIIHVFLVDKRAKSKEQRAMKNAQKLVSKILNIFTNLCEFVYTLMIYY